MAPKGSYLADSSINHSLHLYESGVSDLLVFSKKSGRLYGFDEIGASFFYFLKNEEGSKNELLNAVGNSETARTLIQAIDDLLNSRGVVDVSSENTLEYPLAATEITLINPFYYQLDSFVFVIDANNELIIEKIMPALSHLLIEHSASNGISVNIDIVKEKNGWSICFNSKELYSGMLLDEVLPRLLNGIRIAYYRSIDYLISLHAGALSFNNIPLILPAASGSGKSTLTAYLMENNFEFFTDDVIVVDKNECIRPIPLSVMIKEGSWKVLEKQGIHLSNLSSHRHKRFDGQKLRFLPPKHIAKGYLDTNGAYLIFPSYAAGEATKLESLTTLQALNHIMKSGYEVEDSYDEKTIEQWIALVETFKKYSITYSDLEDARLHIERLMSIEE